MHGHAQDYGGRAAEPSPQPRCTIWFENNGTWSALRGAILLASGLPTAAAAWDVIDQAERRTPAAVRPPASRRRIARSSWTAS
jgi:hypothetical protein